MWLVLSLVVTQRAPLGVVGSSPVDGTHPPSQHAATAVRNCSLFVSNEDGRDYPHCGLPGRLPCATLQQAVDLALLGDVVCVQSTSLPYVCHPDGNGTLVTKSLTIESVGNASVVIDCQGRGRAFSFVNPLGVVTLRGFTVTGGYAVQGGGLVSTCSRTVIERCLFYNNVAVAGGGAVLFYGGDSTLVDNTFLNNTIGTGAGGGVAINAPCGSRHRLLGNVFARNRITTCADSVCFGGGLGLLVGLASGASLTAVQLCSGTQVTMNSNTFEDNVVQMVLHRQGRGGGAAVSYYPTIAMAPLATANHHQAINNTFKRNCADYGGGMVIEYWSGLASGNSHNVTSNRFVENTANAESAGLRLDYGWNSSDGDHVFHRNSFLRNVARFSAGGLHVGPSFDSWNHSFELVENQFIGNIAHGFGAGAVYLHGHSIHSARFTFSRNTMQDNSAGLGGGLFVLCPNQCIGNTYLVDHNDIRNNSALIAGGGIHIRNLNAAPNTTYKFVGNTFDRNSAPSGGAVWILNEPDPMQCDTAEVPWWDYTNYVHFQGDRLTNNAVTFWGGAIYLVSGVLTLDDCVLVNNSGQLGGAIYLAAASSALNVTCCSFAGNEAASMGGHLWSQSAAALALVGSNFTSSSDSLVAVTHTRRFTFAAGLLACEAGAGLVDTSSRPSLDVLPGPCSGLLDMRAILISCDRCSAGSYNLLAGWRNSTFVSSFVCHACPSGATCPSGGSEVLALPDHWCRVALHDPSAAECVPCPMGYCCQQTSCPWGQTCASSRTGTLCGECLPGFSESFGTTDCVPDGECDAALWLVPAALVIGLLYALVLLFVSVRRHPLWKSTIYFLQVVPLVAGSTKNPVLSVLLAISGLDPSVLGIHVRACPYPGMNALVKLASSYIGPVVLLLALLALFTIHALWRGVTGLVSGRKHAEEWEQSYEDSDHEPLLSLNGGLQDNDGAIVARPQSASDQSGQDQPMPHRVRYVGALIALVLLFYQSVTATTMELLHCVSLDDHLRLFRAGVVECYVAWQYPLFLLLLVLLPLPLVLPLLAYSFHRQGSRSDTAQAVLGVLERPYKPKRRWWESAVLLRRVMLLAIATFVLDPLWRALGLFIGCFVVAVTHFVFEPHADGHYGGIEAAYLCHLALIAAFRTPLPAFTMLRLKIDADTLQALHYIQEVLVVLPLIYCAAFVTWKFGRPLFSKRCHRV